MCLAIWLWAIAEGIFQIVGGRYSIFEIIWIRYGTHLLLMILVFGKKHKNNLWKTRRLSLQLARGTMMIGMPVLAVMGSKLSMTGNGLSLFQLAPLIVTFFAIFFLRERPSPINFYLLFSAFAGALILIKHNFFVFDPGCVLIFGSVLCFSLYQIMTVFSDSRDGWSICFIPPCPFLSRSPC